MFTFLSQPVLAYNRTLEAQVAERAEALQQQQEILQTLFDHIPVMLAFYQNESLLLVNREFERVLSEGLGGEFGLIASDSQAIPCILQPREHIAI